MSNRYESGSPATCSGEEVTIMLKYQKARIIYWRIEL
jgi:hypothetical protein